MCSVLYLDREARAADRRAAARPRRPHAAVPAAVVDALLRGRLYAQRDGKALRRRQRQFQVGRVARGGGVAKLWREQLAV